MDDAELETLDERVRTLCRRARPAERSPVGGSGRGGRPMPWLRGGVRGGLAGSDRGIGGGLHARLRKPCGPRLRPL